MNRNIINYPYIPPSNEAHVKFVLLILPPFSAFTWLDTPGGDDRQQNVESFAMEIMPR